MSYDKLKCFLAEGSKNSRLSWVARPSTAHKPLRSFASLKMTRSLLSLSSLRSLCSLPEYSLNPP